MAQRTITSSGINGGYDVTSAQNTINALKNSMVANAKINMSDINALINLWNAFNGHTHGIQDLWGLKEFGNTNPGYSYYLGYWYLSYKYAQGPESFYYAYESGTFTGPDSASVSAQYNALPATKDFQVSDGYGGTYTITTNKYVTAGPSPAYGTAAYATAPGNYDNDTSYGPNLAGDIGTINQSLAVSAAKINELTGAMAGKANHSHTWDDRTGP